MGLRLGLKTAILATGKTQRQIAFDCEMSENRLSELVRAWEDSTEDERRKLARALRRDARELFGRQVA